MKKILSGSAVKITAALSMLIDHAAIILNRYNVICEPVYKIMRGVGRLAFPLFTFLIVEGFIHTKSVAKYITRLAVFAFLSEVPFDILNYGKIFYAGHNNVLFTYVIAVCILWAVSGFLKMGTKGMIYMFLLVAVGMASAFLLKTDYSWRGVMLALVFYIMHDYKPVKYITGALVLVMSGSLLCFAAPLSFIIMEMYDGRKGRMPRYVMYVFYPLHMLVLGIAGMMA